MHRVPLFTPKKVENYIEYRDSIGSAQITSLVQLLHSLSGFFCSTILTRSNRSLVSRRFASEQCDDKLSAPMRTPIHCNSGKYFRTIRKQILHKACISKINPRENTMCIWKSLHVKICKNTIQVPIFGPKQYKTV